MIDIAVTVMLASMFICLSAIFVVGTGLCLYRLWRG